MAGYSNICSTRRRRQAVPPRPSSRSLEEFCWLPAFASWMGLRTAPGNSAESRMEPAQTRRRRSGAWGRLTRGSVPFPPAQAGGPGSGVGLRGADHVWRSGGGPGRQLRGKLDLHWTLLCHDGPLDADQRPGTAAVRPLSVHSPESPALLSRCDSGAGDHDESETGRPPRTDWTPRTATG